jgi:hypothetical protein
LIALLHEKTGEKVIILIDEYDKPITSYLLTPLLNDVKTTVHDLYQVMKDADDHVQFIFLTGVSKFSGLSVFSALNNPHDITLSDDFDTICGYTQKELECYFAEYLAMTKENLLKHIRHWYNGYSWGGKTSVYNPFSTLLFLRRNSIPITGSKLVT